MAQILVITLVACAFLACTFGLCERLVRRRGDFGDGRDSFNSPSFPGVDGGSGEAAQLAARRRMARQLGLNISAGDEPEDGQ
jgi:hypothetical protein